MSVLGSTSNIEPSSLELRDARRKIKDRLSVGIIQLAAFATSILVVGLIVTIIWRGAPAINWEFLTQPPREGMKQGGIGPMIFGSVLLMLGTLLIVLPVGIFGGVFLAEYAGRSRFAGFVQSCITALAGTPSIVFGLFGFAFFVLMLKWNTSLIAGWATLSAFALPFVVLTTDHAIRSVPDSLVEAAYALGLTKWQAIRKVILPNAMPGILSGLVLMTGRAAGEAPLILLTASIYYTTEQVTLNRETLFKPVMNLPYHLAEGYRQGGVIPERTIWGTCLTLLLFVLLLNLGAIIIRSRMRWKKQL